MSSIGSREAKARVALDKAEQIIIEKFTKFNLSENSKDNLDKIRQMWNSASNGYSIAENFTDIPEKILKSKGRAIILFAETAMGNVLIDSTMGESKMKQAVGALGDAIITGAALLTPQGWIITGANLALSLVGWDLGSIFKKIYGEDNDNISITPNGFIEVRNDDGSIYTKPLSEQARKILNIGVEPSGSISGDGKDDVLFGGNKDDKLTGSGGSDLLLGGNGYDTYFADGKDIIRDDDGKGQVYFNGLKLTDATQIEKGSNIYKTKDNIKYEVKPNQLIVNDSLVIENFNPYKEYLDINLLQVDEIAVSVSDASAKEKEQSMKFTISLSRDLKEGEFVKVTIPKIGNNEAKTYMFLHGSSTDWKVGDGIEYIFDSSTTYTYSWSDDENVEPDETISVKATIIDKPENLIAKDGKVGIGTIQDDDDDPDNPNDTFPDTDPASTKTSPIVIDLNNDGVKTISRKANKIYFDLDNNKFAQNTAWVDSNDGILINKALITDNNITNGSQLFGNHTLLTNGNLATNGFEALKEFDENNDGIINELDQNAYENLAIWQDINSNAKLDNNELKSLKEFGIKEINLNYTNSSFIDENGNEHRQTSSVVFENGNKASISDVWLDNHTADTKYVGEKISLSNEIRALPQIYAFGEVLNLRQAMAQDEVLKTNLNLLVA